MRYLVVAALILTFASCVPETDDTPRVHDVALYGPEGNIRYSYFFGPPERITIGGTAYQLSQGRSDESLAVEGALIIGGRPYFQERLGQRARPFEVARTPNSTDLNVRVTAPTGRIVYYDGNLWFDLVAEANRGLNTRVTPRERLDGLRGLGNLTNAEADALMRHLGPRGPLAVAVVPDARPEPLDIPAASEYLRTALFVQEGLGTTQQVSRPSIRDLNYEVLARGNQATGGEGARFVIATNDSELSTLWNQAYGAQLTPPPLPDVNFRNDSVVAMFLGQRPTGGYSVEVQNVSLEDDEVYVSVRTTSPGADAITTQALTNPWVMVRVPRADLRLAWFRSARGDELLGVARR